MYTVYGVAILDFDLGTQVLIDLLYTYMLPHTKMEVGTSFLRDHAQHAQKDRCRVFWIFPLCSAMEDTKTCRQRKSLTCVVQSRSLKLLPDVTWGQTLWLHTPRCQELFWLSTTLAQLSLSLWRHHTRTWSSTVVHIGRWTHSPDDANHWGTVQDDTSIILHCYWTLSPGRHEVIL